MPVRKHKRYSRPRKMFDIALIKEEQGLIKKYGLKSRREVWRASFAVETIRNLAKELITADEKLKKEFVERQAAKGFNVNNIADVLGLGKEDYLKRRLQSVVVAKKLAQTHNQARQMITHKHIKLNGHFINSPSHLTTIEEENSLESTMKLPEKKTISKEEKALLEKMRHSEGKAEETA
jgi:small subunit ribosomal protein S4